MAHETKTPESLETTPGNTAERIHEDRLRVADGKIKNGARLAIGGIVLMALGTGLAFFEPISGTAVSAKGVQIAGSGLASLVIGLWKYSAGKSEKSGLKAQHATELLIEKRSTATA